MATEFLIIKNRAYSKLAATLTSGATTMTVTSGEGANFPSTYPFHLTIEDEIVSVTNRATDAMTIVRARQGTSAAAHPNKAHVALNITAKSFTDINTAVNALEGNEADYLLVDGSRATSELRLTPKVSSSGPEGTMFYDSDDDHVWVATEA